MGSPGYSAVCSVSTSTITETHPPRRCAIQRCCNTSASSSSLTDNFALARLLRDHHPTPSAPTNNNHGKALRLYGLYAKNGGKPRTSGRDKRINHLLCEARTTGFLLVRNYSCST